MALFPADFADLEPFAQWSLPTESERFALRLANTMDTLQAFYDAAFPRLDAAMDHLDQYPLDALPEPERRLLWLLNSLMTVSFPIEVWRQPRVPDSGAASLECVIDLRP